MKKIIKTLLFVSWLILIYLLSAETGDQSGSLSDGILLSIAKLLKISDTKAFVDTFGFFIRKLAHFSEYFILYILTYECFKEYNCPKLIVVSVLFCVLYASFDEFHQLFVDGRCGQLSDAIIDSSGSIVSCFLWRLVKKK
ncbi:MAG: VanZ family protein [Erysipelotrichaceae bacterium]|nr:VanZ family protein [Solobacterium sp.]MDD7775896.1 VanZ family protein [Solobacterium sp.]MDY2952371.1 VanZ family protein [Erysipelotrichaceae bacterium]MDY5277764.1 VanZ family protein [Erysipelotrichaceae bacterium]MDY5401534.1 VanZ family protein [Erysipelotrichaceae bacterium]